MDITISLSPEEEKRLVERASASGEDLAGYVHRLIERHIKASEMLTELLAPIRREFADSGISEDELDALVDEVREEVWQEKHSSRTFPGKNEPKSPDSTYLSETKPIARAIPPSAPDKTKPTRPIPSSSPAAHRRFLKTKPNLGQNGSA